MKEKGSRPFPKEDFGLLFCHATKSVAVKINTTLPLCVETRGIGMFGLCAIVSDFLCSFNWVWIMPSSPYDYRPARAAGGKLCVGLVEPVSKLRALRHSEG